MKEINDSSIIRKSGNHVETIVDGETVLMHIVDGKFFSLNGTSQRAWELICDDMPFGDLVTAMISEYQIDRETCALQLQDMLGQLQKRTLVDVL